MPYTHSMIQELKSNENKIGATIFVRDAIKYDYCIIEAITSLLGFDEVVIMDCSSEDGTREMIIEHFGNYEHVKIVTYQRWEIGVRYDRLALLANIAKSYLSPLIKWHFMLQADEVLEDGGVAKIRRLIENHGNNISKFVIRRYNLWGNSNLYIRFDSGKKPCSDTVCRLALREFEAVGDAESIDPIGASLEYIDEVSIIHYGFVRKGTLMLQKIIDMQAWFWNNPYNVDKRAKEQLATDGVFRPAMWIPREELKILPFYMHPSHCVKWCEERVSDPTFERIYI